MEAATTKKALFTQVGQQSKQAFPRPKGTPSQILPSHNGEGCKGLQWPSGPSSLLKQRFKQWPCGQQAPQLKASLLPWKDALVASRDVSGELQGPPLLEEENPPP